ncbi:MAG: selenide, water dikinase SelD [Flavipsychrobacter sp.]|nr:selenide, water dikinase SelD [Flavipsychrobacter sp.]
MEEAIKLTQFSRGAGCGCKIAPAVLQEILQTDVAQQPNPNLLVGNDANDDAAAYDMGNGKALIATTDFFMPIVDDAYDFGRIAAANAISDVYAMGGTPALALAILGWPVDRIPVALAKRALEGARSICAEAGIPLAGGHSIDSSEPIFGLSVNGFCDTTRIKRNNTAREGDVLFVTKAIGTGILATALKRGAISEAHTASLTAQLTKLNAVGAALGNCDGVTAMTDITGFGLAGHLIEMAEGSGLSAVVNYSALPIMDGVKEYLAQRIVPDATYRNWNGYHTRITFGDGVDVMEAFSILPDPQTNGGLLVAVRPDAVQQVCDILVNTGYSSFTTPIGHLTAPAEKVVNVVAN